MPYQPKKDEKGMIVVNTEGLPVWVDTETKEESAFDVNTLRNTITDRRQKAKTFEDEAKGLREKLKAVEDIEDLSAFRKQAEEAIQKSKSKTSEPAEVESNLRKQWADEVKQKDEAITDLTKKNHSLIIGGAFQRSPLFARDGKINLSADIAYDVFGSLFKYETDQGKSQIVAYSQGQPIYSKKDQTSYADVDEALEILISQRPDKDRLYRFQGGSGSGATGGRSGEGVDTLQIQLREAEAKGDVQKMMDIKNKLIQRQLEAMKS